MIYLDNAATTFPKPAQVERALMRVPVQLCGNPGRGGHRMAERSAEEVYLARESVSRLFLYDRPDRVVFTLNATHALNTAIKGLSIPGSHILISDMEHNSVRRAVISVCREGCRASVFRTYPDAGRTLRSVEDNVFPDTKMIVACHRSNICGRELPIYGIAEICRKRGIIFIVDASQSAGSCPVDFKRLGANVLCAPGHKGMFGIMGCGFMLISGDLDPKRIRTLTEGGSGVDSLSDRMPDLLPERLEAGTLPLPAICTLRAGAEFIMKTGAGSIGDREESLADYARERLGNIPGVKLYLPEENHTGIVLFNITGRESEESAEYLDKSCGICTRAGFHCSPLAHRAIGTPPHGAVRASFGYFNTEKDADMLIKGVSELAGKR